MEKNNKTANSSDFEVTAVPQSGRKSLWTLVFIFAGWGLNSSEIISGGTIAAPLGLTKGVVAIIIATAVNCALAVLLAVPGAKKGLGFALMTRHTYGNIGSKIPSVVISVVHFGWYGILTALLANVAIQVMPSLNFKIVAIVAGLAIAVVAAVGIKATAIIGYLAVPCVLIVGLIGVFKLTGSASTFMPGTGGSTIPMGISQGVGAFAVGSLLACDIARFSRTKGQAALGVCIGLFIGLGFVRVLGAMSVLTTGQPDIVLAFAALGMAGAAFLFLFLNIVSTTDNILYSTGLSLSNIFRWNRVYLTLIAGVLGTVVAVMGLDKFFGAWLNFLASIIPPMGGVVIADYYFVKRRDFCELEDIKCPFNVFALIAWACGIAAAMLNIWCPAIDGLIASILVYVILMYAVKKSRPEYYCRLTNTQAKISAQ